MMKDLKLIGKWWIPSNPNKQIGGVLTSTENSNPTLNLESSFWDDPWAKVSEPQLILGESEDKTIITLYNIETQTNVLVSLSFKIDFVFIGVHFYAVDEIIFDSIDIRYSDTDNWISINDFERYSSSNQTKQKPIHNKVISANAGDGFMVDLMEDEDHFAKPRIYIRIKSSNGGKHCYHYFKMKNTIQDFLSFALARPIHSLSIVGLTHTNKLIIQIYYAEFSDPLIAQREYDRALFLFRHISQTFEACLSKWKKTEDALRDVVALYISVVNSPSMYLELQFLLIIDALENYHRKTIRNQEIPVEEHELRITTILQSCPLEFRKWLREKLNYSNEPHLRKRVKELISKYEHIFPRYVDDRKDFVDRIVKTRNYYTHFDSKQGIITDPKKLREVTDKVMGLLEVCLFTEIATIEEIKKIYGLV